MNTLWIGAAVVVAASAFVGCKSESGGGAATKASGGPAANAANAANAKTPAKEAAAKPAYVQKGIPAGKVVVGYLVDNSDPAQCAVVVDAPAKKDAFKKDADKLAELMKAKVVTSCPTDNVVGTCNAGLGMLVNYSGPKWTTESAKKDCTGKPHQKWVE
jgi:hypothetical protein